MLFDKIDIKPSDLRGSQKSFYSAFGLEIYEHPTCGDESSLLAIMQETVFDTGHFEVSDVIDSFNDTYRDYHD